MYDAIKVLALSRGPNKICIHLGGYLKCQIRMRSKGNRCQVLTKQTEVNNLTKVWHFRVQCQIAAYTLIVGGRMGAIGIYWNHVFPVPNVAIWWDLLNPYTP